MEIDIILVEIVLRFIDWYTQRPIYNLVKPIEVAALLLLSVVKCKGEISVEQKCKLIQIFENVFHLSNSEANNLFLASSRLIHNEKNIVNKLPKILKKSANRINHDQIQSILMLMNEIGALESALNDKQKKLIAGVEKFYYAKN